MGDHVFVCYAREDEDFALELATNLKNRGVPIWLDQWNILPADDWDRFIDKALYGCKYFLIILSLTSVESKEVRGELRTALDENKIIVPILYQLCQIPRQLRLIQYTNFVSRSPDDKESLEQVLRTLGMAKNIPEKPIPQSEQKKEASDWGNARALNKRGVTLYGKGKHDEAIEAFNKAIKLDPRYAQAWYNIGIAFNAQGKFDEAIKAFDKTIEIKKAADPWYKKGIILESQGNYGEAIKAYDKAIELYPGSYSWGLLETIPFSGIFDPKYLKEARDRCIRKMPFKADRGWVVRR